MSDELLAEFLEQQDHFTKNDILWHWVPNRSEFGRFDDIAQAYVVVKLAPDAYCGMCVYARYRGIWDAPFSSRPVIAKLLNLVS